MTGDSKNPIPAWRAYDYLFKIVMKLRNWSVDNLVDALNEDGRDRPDCEYAGRSLQAYKTNPLKKSARTPNIEKVHHLHEFFRKELKNFDKAEKFASYLTAIAGAEEGWSDASGLTGKQTARRNEMLANDLVPLEDVVVSCWQLLHAQLEKKAQTDLANVASKHFLCEDWQNAALSFNRLAEKKFARLGELSKERERAEEEALSAWLHGAIALLQEGHLDAALLSVSKAIKNVSEDGNPVTVANLQNWMGLFYTWLSDENNGEPAAKYSELAVDAYRVASKCCRNEEPSSEVRFVSNYNLGVSLIDQSDRSANNIAVALLGEAVGVLHPMLDGANDADFAEVSQQLSVALIKQCERSFDSPEQKNNDLRLKKAIAICDTALGRISHGKLPEKQLKLQVFRARAFVCRGAEALIHFSCASSENDAILYFQTAKKILLNVIQSAVGETNSEVRIVAQKQLALVEDNLRK